MSNQTEEPAVPAAGLGRDGQPLLSEPVTPGAAPDRRSRSATRLKLIRSAPAVFAQQGIDGASVSDLCAAAGFTRGAFYSNFETKDELFLELAGNVARERVAAVRGRGADGHSAERGERGARAAAPRGG